MRTLEAARPVLDEQLVVLSDAERRRLLATLLVEDEPIDVREFSEEGESGTSFVEMYHRHLPILEDGGFVWWDRETQLVTAGPQFQEIRPLMELLYDHRDELPVAWR